MHIVCCRMTAEFLAFSRETGNDLSTPVDDIQKELDKVSATSQVDNELAALKLELGGGGSDEGTAALPAADQSGNGGTPS